MRITRLEITCFRNLSRVAMDLGPGLNTFYGDNGAGKTALLEAVHLLCRGRSFRTQQSRGVIQHGAEQLVVRAVIREALSGARTTLAVSKNQRARTELRLNGQAERRLSRIARITPIQVMLPDIAELVFGAPSRRRSWLDWGVFHVKPDYLPLLRRYLRAVRQRNALIRDGADRALIDPWSQEAAELGVAVSREREAYLRRLDPYFQNVLDDLAPELTVELVYRQGWPREQALHKVLGESGPREVKYSSTPWGPHRADVLLGVEAGTAAAVLSRGQGKMVASALQIAQAALLADQEQRTSVFLIDDAGAELDAAHNRRFFDVLDRVGGQVLATTTRDPGAPGSGVEGAVTFHVKHGTVTRLAEARPEEED